MKREMEKLPGYINSWSSSTVSEMRCLLLLSNRDMWQKRLLQQTCHTVNNVTAFLTTKELTWLFFPSRFGMCWTKLQVLSTPFLVPHSSSHRHSHIAFYTQQRSICFFYRATANWNSYPDLGTDLVRLYLGSGSWLYSWCLVTHQQHSGKQQVLGQGLGSLPPTQKSWIEIPGLWG